jgi:hypothetical protein
MKKKINVLRAVLGGAGVILLNSVFGNLLYMNPLVSGIFAQFKDHPGIRPMEYFGGMENWLGLTMGFGLFLEIFVIILFVLLYQGIPFTKWRKGLAFGTIIGVLRAVPEAFNQWMLVNYPEPLILVQLVNTFLGYIILGFLIGIIFDKAKVISEEA